MAITAFDSKTLMGTQNSDNVTITGGTLTSVTVSSAAATVTGGTIDGTTVGATTTSTGAFTTLSASSTTALSGATTLSGTTTVSGLTTFSTMFKIPRETVAATGTNLATAAALAYGLSTVTAGDGTVGVKLTATPVAGSIHVVKNASASALKVYPDASATINAVGSNGAISMAANTMAIFFADSTTQWYSLSLLPS